MSTAQQIASTRFLNAMGPMVEDQKAMQQVLYCIELIKHQPEAPFITLDELEQNGMPLHTAMSLLRKKAHDFYYSESV